MATNSPEAPATTSGWSAWCNVAAAALLMVATLPGRSHGLGLVTQPLREDLEIDEVVFGQINLWASLIGAAFCIPCGWLIDRIGIRPVLIGVLAGLAAAVLALSAVHSAESLPVILIFVRGFGQSALSVVSLGIVAKTAFRRRETAMAFYSVLVGFGFACAVWQVQLIEKNPLMNWRHVWAGMGVLLLVGVLPLSWVLVREPATTTKSAARVILPGDFTFSAAVRTSAFWAIGLTCALFLFVSSGTALFYEAVLRSFGFNRSEYEQMLAILFLFGSAFNLLCGWLAQVWSLTRMLGCGSLILAISLVMLPLARSMAQLYLYAVAMASAGGVVTVVFFIVWRRLYGEAHVGQIQGAAQLLTVVASAVSQWLFPAASQWANSYVPLLQVLAALALILGVWVWFVPLPRKPSRYESGESLTRAAHS